MTANDARYLLPGDNVGWEHDVIQGAVMERSAFGVCIAWDDGDEGWIDYRDMARIEFRGDSAEMELRRKRCQTIAIDD